MTQLVKDHGDYQVFQHIDRDASGRRQRVVLATEMECDALIRENRRLREYQQIGAKKEETFRLVARFPAPMAEQAMQEGWFHDDKEWERRVNDPQYRDFRVHEGRF